MGSHDLRSLAATLGILLFLTYGWFLAAPTWNQSSRFALTRSLVDRGSLDIEPFHHETGDKALRGGRHYSDKAPGASLLAAPAYALFRATGAAPSSIPKQGGDPEGFEILVNPAYRRALYVCNLATNALAGALLGALFFLALCRHFGVAPRTALGAALGLGLGSLVLPYATMFYGHVLAGALLFAAFFLLLEPPSRVRLAGAGGLAGLAVLTEMPAAPAALALGLWALWRQRQAGLWFAAGAVVPLLALAAYQLAAFGSPWQAGYGHVTNPAFAEGMSRGVFGVGLPRPSVLAAMLVGRSRGLLYTAPVLALALWGLARLAAGRAGDAGAQAAGRVAAVLVGYFLLMSAGYYMWWGGSALGPRHLIPALPFLCLGLPFAFARPRPVVFGVLLALSIAHQLVATAVGAEAPLTADVLRDHVYAHLLRGEVPWLPGASNLGNLFRLRGPASLLPLLVIWALGLAQLRQQLVTMERAARVVA